jgi:hypothetical protein
MFSLAFPSQPERNVVRGGASEENKRLFHPSWDDPETESSNVRCALKKPGVFLSHFPGAQLSCLSPPLLHEWLPTERGKRRENMLEALFRSPERFFH